MRPKRTSRGAFTLIELLVAMAFIVLLASLTLAITENMGDRDYTTDAAALTRQWLMQAKNRAGRDNAPRGVRLIVGPDPNNIAKQSPFFVTELQFIEAPPILVTYPAANLNAAPSGSLTDPAVWITYTLSNGAPANPGTLGDVMGKQCQIVNLPANIVAQIVPNSILQLPLLGTWHRILAVTSVTPMTGLSTGLFSITVTLDSFPDAPLGAAGVLQPLPQPAAGATPPCYVTQHFGITSPPRPLMGEPPLQLPKNICIDLTPPTIPPPSPPGPAPPAPPYLDSPSKPFAAGPLADYDILFSPTGQVVPVGAGAGVDGAIYLWVRDYTKLRNAPNGNNALVVTNAVSSAPFPPRVYDRYPFEYGGVQQIVAIRCKTGGLGQFDALWPDASGQYFPGEDPYTIARQKATP